MNESIRALANGREARAGGRGEDRGEASVADQVPERWWRRVAVGPRVADPEGGVVARGATVESTMISLNFVEDGITVEICIVV